VGCGVIFSGLRAPKSIPNKPPLHIAQADASTLFLLLLSLRDCLAQVLDDADLAADWRPIQSAAKNPTHPEAAKYSLETHVYNLTHIAESFQRMGHRVQFGRVFRRILSWIGDFRVMDGNIWYYRGHQHSSGPFF
jgi:hypothetical protein